MQGLDFVRNKETVYGAIRRLNQHVRPKRVDWTVSTWTHWTKPGENVPSNLTIILTLKQLSAN